MRLVERLQWRKLVVSELVERLRLGQVLEPVPAEFDELAVAIEEEVRRLGHEHLPAMARAHHPRAAMDVDADVALLGEQGLT